MEKVLVTGGGGFIGSHLAKYLYEKGHYVVVADVKFDGYLNDYCHKKITTDLRSFENCIKVTKDMTRVYNLAANMGGIGFITEIGAEVMHDNALINIHMLEAARQNNVDRYLYTSSACIYPTYRQTKPDLQGLKEEDAIPADPDNFYGWEKLFTEKLCEAYQRDHGSEVRVLRYHNIYGPEGTYKGGREKSPAALCRKVAEASNPGEITVWGDGKQSRTYCYIDDALIGTITLMESDCRVPVNIGSSELVTIDRLADMIIEISDKNIEKKYDLKAAQGVRGRSADLTLVRNKIGWEPKVRLKEGLARTYQWIDKMVNNTQPTKAVAESPLIKK